MVLHHGALPHTEVYDIICENGVKVRNGIIPTDSLLTLDPRMPKNCSTCDIHPYEMPLNISSEF